MHLGCVCVCVSVFVHFLQKCYHNISSKRIKHKQEAASRKTNSRKKEFRRSFRRYAYSILCWSRKDERRAKNTSTHPYMKRYQIVILIIMLRGNHISSGVLGDVFSDGWDTCDKDIPETPRRKRAGKQVGEYKSFCCFRGYVCGWVREMDLYVVNCFCVYIVG